MEQTFEGMHLNRSLVEALKLADITVPTEIQQKVIPEAQKSNDLIFQSETGTGKTLAYLLPLFEKIDTEKKEMQALILVPTHELAIQVIRVIEMLSLNSDLKVSSTPVIGDVNITRQVDKLRTKPHIIVGTAGRVLELIQKKKISAHTIKTIIIDEADRLLDDSNIEGIKAVVKTTLKERQIVMCSASMSARTVERAKLLMKDPQVIKSKNAIEVPETIDHIYFVAEQRDKIEVLRKLVRIINPPKAIAFFANAEDIAEAAEKLKYHKLRADGLHGSNVKSDRKKTMDDFKSGRLQLLIASDIAARGLDIEGVTHIFNVNIPERSMEYLHRAGRTGRNGNEGVAISIVAEEEIPFIKQYEKELRISIIPRSMYNGAIVEYRKEKKKFDTISEYDQRSSKGYNRKSETESGEAGEKPKSAFKHGQGDRPVKKFDKDRPDRKYRQPGKDKAGDDPKKGGRDGSRSDKSGKKTPFGGTKFKIGGKSDNKYNHDERQGSRLKRDGDKPEAKFNRDDRSAARFKKDSNKPAAGYKRDDRSGTGFKKDSNKPAAGYKRDDRSAAGFKKDSNKPAAGYNRDDRGEKRFGKDSKPADHKKFGSNKPDKKFERDDKKEGGFGKDKKQTRVKFVGKPPKNLKPWERKPQKAQKKEKK